MSTDVNQHNDAQEFPWARTALIFGSILLLGIGGAGLAAHADRGSRTSLESVAEPASAVGDAEFFDLEKHHSGETAVTVDGKPFQIASEKKLKISDTKMTPARKDDSGKYTLYARAKAESPGELYLRVGEGEFARISAR